MRSLGVVTATLCMLWVQAGCGKVASCPPGADLLSDRENCGACGHPCGDGEACGEGTCVSCPQDHALCGASCVATDSDAMNCGGCGVACNIGEACIASECQVPCDPAQLMQPSLSDPWGIRWDAVKRPAAALDVAQATCKAFGGRLPTPTEIYRASATQSGTVGQSFNTEPLWSQAPNDKLNQAAVRLSDGVASTLPASSPADYRCVCPAVLPKTFTAAHCHGKLGSECFTVGGYNFDSADRPALRRSAALWQCINERAHLADLPELVEAIQAGLPGSNQFVATADASDPARSSEIRWTTAPWTSTGNLSAVDLRTPAPFRCAAPNFATSPNPNPIANQFVGPLSRYKGETADRAVASWVAAHDTCTSLGGHVPRATELAELIMQGLPDGSSKPVWSADQLGFDTAQFQVALNNWTALDLRYSYANGGADQTVTASYKNATHPFRCIYYPLDPAYAAPTACNGGCFVLAFAGDPAPTLWFDSNDRPAMKLPDAIMACSSEKAHLPSERDLTEAIRAGLPNGIGGSTFLHTSDVGRGNNMVVRWTGVGDSTYADLYSTNMNWNDPATLRPYRCMWTNELR